VHVDADPPPGNATQAETIQIGAWTVVLVFLLAAMTYLGSFGDQGIMTDPASAAEQPAAGAGRTLKTRDDLS
jgi:hypothetical protein